MLNTLTHNPGSKKKRHRICRGIGSGKGKTGGRGGKGQTARSGVAINGFEGGQMPLYRRLPIRGFVNYTRIEYQPVDLLRVAEMVAAGKIPADDVTPQTLKASGLIRSANRKVKLLGGFSEPVKLKVMVDALSATAQRAIQVAGGGIILRNR